MSASNVRKSREILESLIKRKYSGEDCVSIDVAVGLAELNVDLLEAYAYKSAKLDEVSEDLGGIVDRFKGSFRGF